MPASRNPFTGRRRRRGSRNLPRKRRHTWRLDVNKRDFLTNTVHPQIQNWSQRAQQCQFALFALFMLRDCVAVQFRNHPHFDLAIQVLDGQMFKEFFDLASSLSIFQFWVDVDAAIGDIPEEEDNHHPPPFHGERTYRRVDDFFNDDQATIETSFSKQELRQLMELFELPIEVRVPRSDGNFDVFHREELLIFTLIKLRKGLTNATVVDHYVGGQSEARWGRGYKWLITYLDDRYAPIIGPEGLALWVDQFPTFAEKIRAKLAKQRTHRDPDTHQVIEIEPGVYFEPGTFAVVGLVDCKEYKMRRPHSGPAADYAGAMRRPGWYWRQRAFYTGRTKKHALKVLSFCLPNGLTGAVYGPVSARRHDTTVLTWSGIDPFLTVVQQGMPHAYAFYGDSAFRGVWANIRTRHEPTPFFPLTPRQQDENRAMYKARVVIEWSYGLLCNLWKLSTEVDAFKLETDADAVCRQVRVMHFLTNCNTCIHGNEVSSRHTFECRPPSLEQYLAL